MTFAGANDEERHSVLLQSTRHHPRSPVNDERTHEALALFAHELRSPLGAIRSAVEVLRQRGEDRATRAWVQIMVTRQIDQMVCLIEEVRDLSRMSVGKGPFHKQLVELALVVNRAVETALPGLDERRHVLEVTLPREAVLMNANPARLEQMITNLLANAAKYTDPGGKIVLSAMPEGDDVVIRVRDNGIGMAPETLARVFDICRQAARASDRFAGGLGIGLALAKAIVVLHGGSVTALSDGPGCGSEFVVRLPRITGDRTDPGNVGDGRP
jgi:signal transduction histidine kinase